MAVGMVKAGSQDSIFGSGYHSNPKKLLTGINISTGMIMTPKDFVKVCKVDMLKSYLIFTLVHLEYRAQYKDLNMFMTPFSFRRVLLF